MSSIVIQGDTSGSITVEAPSVAGTHTLTLPKATGNIATDATVGLGTKNLIINGDMRIDQRNAGSSTTASGYTVDRWRTDEVTDGTLTAQQVTDAPSGFSYSYKLTVGTADTSIASNQYSFTMQKIEANNLSHLNYGTANAKTITLSFWVKSSITGNYSLVLKNNAQDFSYIHEYTINVANTWEKKTVTVTGPTSGTWITTGNSNGLSVLFTHAVGSTYATSTLDSWHSSSNILGSTTSTNLFQTSGATWQITAVQLEIGENATPFENRMYSQELAMCQRYYQEITKTAGYDNVTNASVWQTTNAFGVFTWLPMRASPTLTATFTDFVVRSGGTSYNATGGSFANIRPDRCQFNLGTSGLTVGRGAWYTFNTDAVTSPPQKIAISAEL